MFEDFRKQTDESTLAIQPPEENDLRGELVLTEPEQHFLGMTAFQRFALVLLLFIMVAILGAFFLLITDTVVPPALG